MTNRQVRVLMLLHDDWKHDSRVIREANVLARAGYAVTVLCRRAGISEPVVEKSAGVEYRCVPAVSARFDALKAILIHRRIIRGWNLGRGKLDSRWHRLIDGWLAGLLLVPLVALIRRSLALVDRITRSGRLAGARNRLALWLNNRLEAATFLNHFAVECGREVANMRPDVIHAHDVLTLSCAAIESRRSGARVVYDAHELHPHTNYQLAPRTFDMIYRYERALLADCAGVITVSASIADWMSREYDIRRPTLVMNTPALEPGTTAAPSVPNVRGTLGLPPDAPLVVYVGSVTIDRGLERCVEALAMLPGVYLACVGPRYEVTATLLRETAERLGVVDQLLLVDPVPSDAVVGFIGGADCSVMAIQNTCLSYYYCFPNKLLESVFAGIPVVAADLPELRAFVERFEVGVVVNEKNPDSIASGIRRILGSPDNFRASTGTRAQIAAEFGWQSQAARLVELYDRQSEIAPALG